MKNLGTTLNNFRSVVIFVLLAVIITLIYGSIYGSVQQVYRSLANDPQVDVVDQLAGIIKQDIPLEAIIGEADQIEIADSKGLFVMVFDKNKNLVGSSAVLNGKALSLPSGVFDQANQDAGNRFTWEPEKGLRMAVVLKQIDDKGYALAGRSLKETELRTNQITTMLIVAWTLSLLVTLVLSLVLKPRRPIEVIEETNVTVVENSPESLVE